jgi:[ribosomal protein S5]-alanine N-acetyltransferase
VTVPPTLPLPLPDPALVDGSVLLRPWRTEDAPVLADAWADPDIARWTGAPAGCSPEDARRWIEGEADRRNRGLALDLVVTLHDVPVGEVGIARFDRRRRVAEIGWWTAPEYRSRGLASTASRLVVGWAITELCVDRVYARVDPRNPASVGVARNAGLERRGSSEDGLEVWASRLDPAVPVTAGATLRA